MSSTRIVPLPWQRSLAWALQYPGLLTSDGPGRVAWLVRLVAETGGPELSAERPTLAGTRGLWSWYSGWVAAGFPGPAVRGVPRWAEGDSAREAHYMRTPGLREIALVGEAAVHYLAACLQQVDPSFRWAPYWTRGTFEHDFGSPKVVSDSGAWMPLLAWGMNFADSVVAQPPLWGPDTLIVSVVGELRAYGYRVDDDGVPLPGSQPPAPRPERLPLPAPPPRGKGPRKGSVTGRFVVWASRLHQPAVLDPAQLEPDLLRALRQERDTVLTSPPPPARIPTQTQHPPGTDAADAASEDPDGVVGQGGGDGIHEKSLRSAWWNLGLQEVLTGDPDRRSWVSGGMSPRVRLDVLGGDCRARATVLTVDGVDPRWWGSWSPLATLVLHNPVVALPDTSEDRAAFGQPAGAVEPTAPGRRGKVSGGDVTDGDVSGGGSTGGGDLGRPTDGGLADESWSENAGREEGGDRSGQWMLWRSRVHPPGVVDAADADPALVDALNEEVEQGHDLDGGRVPRGGVISSRGLARFARRLGLVEDRDAGDETEKLYTNTEQTIRMEVLLQHRHAYTVQVTADDLDPSDWRTLTQALHDVTKDTGTVALRND